MTNKYILSIATVASCLIWSCEDNKELTYYNNGQIQTSCHVENGIKNGLCENYDSNGTKVSQSFYTNDTLDGTMTLYYPNGEVMAEISIVKGIPQGDERYYYESGELMKQKTNINGETQGLCTTYFRNGNVKSEEMYVNGLLNGLASQYDSTGHLIKQSEYIIVHDNDSLKSVLNTYKYYTKDKSVIDSLSHYFEISSPMDTVIIGSDYTFNITLLGLVYYTDGMYVLIDKSTVYSKLYEEETAYSFPGLNFKARCSVKAEKLGENVFFGNIINYDSTKFVQGNDTVFGQQSRFYFRVSFYVKESASTHV